LLLSAVLRPRVAAPLLLGARRPSLSIDISCPRDAQQQTRRTPLPVLYTNNFPMEDITRQWRHELF